MIWSRLNFHGLKPPFYSYIRILSLLREIGMRRAREDGGKEGWGRDREIDRRRGLALSLYRIFLRQEMDLFNELMEGALIESIQISFTRLVLCPPRGFLNQVFRLTRLLACCECIASGYT